MSEPVLDAEAVEILDPPVAAGSLAVRDEDRALVARTEISVTDLLVQAAKIEEAVQLAMREDVHYGKIPGVSKPTLLKPGAEKLCVLFRLAPHYSNEVIWGPGDHMTVISKCELQHAPTSIIVSTGDGLCSTKETKYAYRTAGRVCPACGEQAIIKGKAEYGGGWVCFKRKGGCGEKWDDASDEGAVFAQAQLGRVANEDIPDSYNTVLKMADKRSLVAAILNGTAASDVFTQDVEDSPHGADRPAGGPAQVRVPRTWAEVEEMVSVYGEATWQDFRALMAAASLHLFPEAEGQLTGEPATVLRQKAAGVAVALREKHDPESFPPPSLSELQNAWSAAVDGAILEPVGDSKESEAEAKESPGEDAEGPEKDAGSVPEGDAA